MGYTDLVTDFVQTIEYDDIPARVIETAQDHILDTVGVALGGNSIELGQLLVDHALATAPGSAATVIGHGQASTLGAAFANGALSNVLEWDDTPGGPHHLSHPSSTIVPASLVAAERSDATGAEVITGYLVGVEVLSRLELVSFPDHYFHGWHDTATYGVFGAAAAVASILHFDEEKIRNTLGIAASFSSGMHKNNSSMTKPVHCGHAAQNGVRAALLAESGITADQSILDDENGYLAVYSPGVFEPSHLETFADEWHMLDYGYKPFPGSTFNHGPQVALLRLLEREDLDPASVEHVSVQLDERAWENLWITQPTDPFEARKSPEFNLATILRERDHTIEQFSEAYVRDPETRRQMEKFERVVGFDNDDFNMFGARLTVTTTDGRTIVEEERRYSPLDVSPDRLERKFRSCAGAILPESGVTRLEQLVRSLDDQPSVAELVTLLCPGENTRHT